MTTTTTTTSSVQAWTAANRINKRTHPPHYYQRRGQHLALVVPYNDRPLVVLHLKKTVSSSTSQQQQQHETKDASSGDNAFDDNSNNDHSQRQRHSIVLHTSGQPATVVSRRVPLDPPSNWFVTIWEWEHTAEVVETYWHVQGLISGGGSQAQVGGLLDPFGLVCWPGAVVAAQELRQVLLDGKRVLILGAGVGVEAQAAAQLGAAHVLATDVHPTTLQLLEYGAEQTGLSKRISTQLLDICEPQQQHPLPPHDILVVADVLYNESLARHVIRRIVEARREHDSMVLVTDSQRFVPDFDGQLSKALQNNDALGQQQVQWSPRGLAQFTGSGVLLDQDQTYEVKARVLWVGMEDDNDN